MDASYQVAWVFGLPLLGFLVQALFGKRILRALGEDFGRKVLGTLAVIPIVLSFGLCASLALGLTAVDAESRASVVTLFDWIRVAGLNIPFELRVDTLSMTMALVVTGVGALIHIYATAYMADDRDYPRFFTYFNLFVASMLLLVLGNNLALLFIGWEGVGLCSYLLIGFWYKEVANAKAANKAFIVNRIGDYGLTLGLFGLIMLVVGSRHLLGDAGQERWLSYDVFLPNAATIFGANPGWTTAIALLLFVGAMGKSAQFPLYVWLPDAMAGPTPVSALIHAATMVTAGVYLLNRMSAIFVLSPVAMGIVALVGAFTALLGALIAFGQTDIKKVLAYSTVSQLGYMFIACGVGAFYAGIFHLMTHAFFKALLFLGSGAVIYSMAHEQDMRAYGNLRKYLPITFLTMAFGWAAIAGVPFLFAGYWSKEAILGAAVNVHGGLAIFGVPAGVIAGWTGFLVAALTAAYMTRMMAMTFLEKERWREPLPEPAHEDHAVHASHAPHAVHDDEFGFTYAEPREEEHEHHHVLGPTHEPKEAPALMWVPLVILALLSTGVVGWWLYEGDGPILQNWLYPGLHEAEGHAVPHLVLVAVSFGVALLGILYGLLLYGRKLPEKEGWDMAKWSPLRLAARAQFGIDTLLTGGSIVGGRILGMSLWQVFDRGIIDGILHFVAGIAGALGSGLRRLQTGLVRGYALLMLLGVIAFVAYLVFTVGPLGGGR